MDVGQLASRRSTPAATAVRVRPVGTPPAIETVACPGEARAAFAALADEAERVDLLLPANAAELGMAQFRRPLTTTLERGVEGRVLHEPALATSTHRLGPHVDSRVTPSVPCCMAILDRSLALVPHLFHGVSQPGLVIFRYGHVQTVLFLFDHLWRRAERELQLAANATAAWEHEVLTHLASGAKDETAARTLGVSPRTYRRAVTRLCDDLGASSRFQAGARAAQAGLI